MSPDLFLTPCSQFFLTLAPAPKCDGKHVVFGQVLEGAEVLARIGESFWRQALYACIHSTVQACLFIDAGSCFITLSVADEEAATEDGIPRLDVTIADCGQL